VIVTRTKMSLKVAASCKDRKQFLRRRLTRPVSNQSAATQLLAWVEQMQQIHSIFRPPGLRPRRQPAGVPGRDRDPRLWDFGQLVLVSWRARQIRGALREGGSEEAHSGRYRRLWEAKRPPRVWNCEFAVLKDFKSAKCSLNVETAC